VPRGVYMACTGKTGCIFMYHFGKIVRRLVSSIKICVLYRQIHVLSLTIVREYDKINRIMVIRKELARL